MKCRASAAASFASPLLKAGWPQQVCARGTSTVQPASLSSFRAAKPTRGRMASTRQVTNRATRGRGAEGMRTAPRGLGAEARRHCGTPAHPPAGDGTDSLDEKRLSRLAAWR